jgi:hypothetical protein
MCGVKLIEYTPRGLMNRRLIVNIEVFNIGVWHVIWLLGAIPVGSAVATYYVCPEIPGYLTASVWWIILTTIGCGGYLTHVFLTRFYMLLYICYSMLTGKQEVMYSGEFDLHVTKMMSNQRPPVPIPDSILSSMRSIIRLNQTRFFKDQTSGVGFHRAAGA